jgi:hypothetical protein
MAYPHFKKKTGRDFNFYKIVAVNWEQFGSPANYTDEDGYGADVFIPFPTQALSFISYGADSANTIEYSFNGNTVHGDMVPQTSSGALVFDNRTVSSIWFRLKTGSTGPVSIRIEAWAKD